MSITTMFCIDCGCELQYREIMEGFCVVCTKGESRCTKGPVCITQYEALAKYCLLDNKHIIERCDVLLKQNNRLRALLNKAQDIIRELLEEY